jgi:hypothetical protein
MLFLKMKKVLPSLHEPGDNSEKEMPIQQELHKMLNIFFFLNKVQACYPILNLLSC